MQVVQTAGAPPYRGRMALATIGCTWKSRKAPRKIAPAQAMLVRAGEGLDSVLIEAEILHQDPAPRSYFLSAGFSGGGAGGSRLGSYLASFGTWIIVMRTFVGKNFSGSGRLFAWRFLSSL